MVILSVISTSLDTTILFWNQSMNMNRSVVFCLMIVMIHHGSDNDEYNVDEDNDNDNDDYS